MAIDEIVRVLPQALRYLVKNLLVEYEKLQEIRLRVGRPFVIEYDNREYFLPVSYTHLDVYKRQGRMRQSRGNIVWKW